MRKVLKNHAEVAHVWASKNQNEGRCGSMFFEGDIMYRYGMHFPIAEFRKMPNGNTVVFFNSNKCSSTTAKHKNEVQHALSGLNYEIFSIPEKLWNCYDSIISHYNSLIHECIAKSKRSYKYKYYHVKDAFILVKKLKKFTEYNNKVFTFKFDNKQREVIKRAFNQHREQKEQSRLKAIENEKRRQKELVELKIACGGSIAEYWHKHGKLPKNDKGSEIFHHVFSLPTFCRVVNNNIETSRGAVVPVRHAKRLYKLIIGVRERGVDYECSVRIGYYSLTKVYADGSVRIGCHEIKWNEVEYIGREIGVL